MILENIIVGPLQVNCYILGCPQTAQGIVIDPGAEPERIKAALRRHRLKLNYIVNTHGHADHIGADSAFDAPIYIHRLDAQFLSDPQLNLSAMLDVPISLNSAVKLLIDGQRIKVGAIELEVLHTPGHTPGGICLLASDFVFTGDTLFAQGVGRTDFPYASEQALIDSIRNRLFILPDELVIYPGHGPSSTIGEEKRNLL